MRIICRPIRLLRLNEIRQIQPYFIIQTLKMMKNRGQFILLKLKLLLQKDKILLTDILQPIPHSINKLNIIGNIRFHFDFNLLQLLFRQESIGGKDLIDR